MYRGGALVNMQYNMGVSGRSRRPVDSMEPSFCSATYEHS